MKKILSLVLALALVLAASAAFADVPGNIKDIEGLPEMPEVPTMTTSVSGTTETIVVSEKLNWLNWVQKYNWNPIEWSEDGLTGTFSIAGLTTQAGFGSYATNDTPFTPYGEIGVSIPTWYNNEKTPGLHDITKGKTVVKGEGFEVVLPASTPWGWHWFWSNWGWGYQDIFEVDLTDPDAYAKAVDYVDQVVAKVAKESGKSEADVRALTDQYGNSVGVGYPTLGDYVYTENERYIYFGTYEQGFTFDGEAANGAHVKYDSFGRVVSVTSTLTGVNFLNMENEPVKTEVTWGVSETEFGRKFYITSIKAFIDDETAVEATFASGGKRLSVK